MYINITYRYVDSICLYLKGILNQYERKMLIHSVSDYKKHLYKKRLVDHVLPKKRTLVYFSDLRNA